MSDSGAHLKISDWKVLGVGQRVIRTHFGVKLLSSSSREIKIPTQILVGAEVPLNLQFLFPGLIFRERKR